MSNRAFLYSIIVCALGITECVAGHTRVGGEVARGDAAIHGGNDAPWVGIHYFGGWWPGNTSHWDRPNPWLPSYPGRRPLLGLYTTNQSTVDAEVEAAAAHGVTYFDVLYYDARRSKALPLNVSQFLFQTSASVARTGFKWMFTWSNDERGEAVGDDEWAAMVEAWVAAMASPGYLRVGGRPVFKILQGETFLNDGCGGNATLAAARIDGLRDMARAARGVGEIVIGVSWIEPFQPLPYAPGLVSAFGFMPDFTGTYNDAIDGRQARYRKPGVVYPWSECADYQNAARRNHSGDVVPYLPNTPASFDPRPWGEAASSFTFPTEAEWAAELSNITGEAARTPVFGLPVLAGRGSALTPASRVGVQSAFTIYAWNEYGEGGIVVRLLLPM